MDCPSTTEYVESRMNRILTQYRESPTLLAIIREDIGQIAEAALAACEIPSKFDIFDAVGDQLTILGKQLGWPREHCICVPVPAFGFSCGIATPNKPIAGLCEGAVWGNCQEAGAGTIRLDDDEVYRGFLLARRYQARQLWDIDSLQASVRHLWGPTATSISLGGARAAIQPGRALTPSEQLQLPVAFRVLPIAPGVTPYISYQTGKVFGFGTGWGGLCDGSAWLCPEQFDPYSCD